MVSLFLSLSVECNSFLFLVKVVVSRDAGLWSCAAESSVAGSGPIRDSTGEDQKNKNRCFFCS